MKNTVKQYCSYILKEYIEIVSFYLKQITKEILNKSHKFHLFVLLQLLTNQFQLLL